eukprot:scaffold47707_cov69-Phaeocystis_antarctica.AAC.3
MWASIPADGPRVKVRVILRAVCKILSRASGVHRRAALGRFRQYRAAVIALSVCNLKRAVLARSAAALVLHVARGRRRVFQDEHHQEDLEHCCNDEEGGPPGRRESGPRICGCFVWCLRQLEGGPTSILGGPCRLQQ